MLKILHEINGQSPNGSAIPTPGAESLYIWTLDKIEETFCSITTLYPYDQAVFKNYCKRFRGDRLIQT